MTRVFILAILAALTASSSFPSTWRVRPDGSGDAPTIRAGIDSAAAGDTVLVSCGTYWEHDIGLKSGVCLRSESGDPGCATIDAEHMGRVLYCSLVDSTASIEGFEIAEGGGPSSHVDGGGIYCTSSSPRIRSCLFRGNRAGSSGGALACFDGSAPRVTDCVFAENTAARAGAALVSGSDPIFRDCRFVANSSVGGGGAVRLTEGSTGSFARCTITENTAYEGGGVALQNAGTSFSECEISMNSAANNGGGIFVLYCQDDGPRFTECTIKGNRARNSGGVHLGQNSCAYFERCAIRENEAEVAGGGMYVYLGCDPDLVDCAFTRNVAERGGAVFVDDHSTPRLAGCTIAGNSASVNCGGVYAKVSRPEIARSIVGFNGIGPGLYCEGSWSSFTLSCVDIFGNTGGDWVGCATGEGTAGNFSSDPLFCDAAGGDYTLQSGSPCLPGQHPDGSDCGLVGAFGQGCAGPTAVEKTSWGGVKSLFR